MRNISQDKIMSVRVRIPSLNEQDRIVAGVEAQLSQIDAMRDTIGTAKRRSTSLRRAILDRAFRRELVPQDPADEPASVLLERVRAERAVSAPTRRTSSRRRSTLPAR